LAAVATSTTSTAAASCPAPNPNWEVGKPHTFDMLGHKVSCSWSPNHPNYIKSGSACFGGNAFLAPFFFCFGPIISAQSSKSPSAGPTVKCGRIQVASKWKLLPTTSMVEIKRLYHAKTDDTTYNIS
jgi:hypothetical protein